MEDTERTESAPANPTDADAGVGEPNPRTVRLMTALKLARELLPGDSRYGEPLSTAGNDPSQQAGRRLGELASERPSVLKEAGLSALQVWEAVARTAGRQRGSDEMVIVFTDLVGFSDWALKVGDEAAVELLRDVGEAIEPPVKAHGGAVVKRLGDGMMAAFADPDAAAAAIFEAFDRLESVEAGGYRPRMRAGMHLGEPKRLGEDFFGVDVNVAARVADAASANEMLVSGATLDELDLDGYSAKKKLLFRAKGVPSDIAVHSLKRRRNR
jgi:adenylate cyclase